MVRRIRNGWLVQTNGETKFYPVSDKSSKIIKESSKKYEEALKRLAKK